MDYDLIFNISVLLDSYDESSQSSWTISLHEIAYAAISFVSLCAHGLVIFTITKNKSMKTPTNVFLLNIIVLDGLYIITSPANMLLPLHYVFTEEIYYITYDIETTLQSGNILMLILFSFNFCVKPKTYLFFVIGTWIITGKLCAIFVVLYIFDNWSYAALHVILFSFALLIVVNTACRVAFWKNVDICPLRLNLITVYVLSWILSWVCVIIWFLSDVYDPTLQKISEICGAVGYSYGIFNILALTYFDKKFKMHLLQAIRCRKCVYDNPVDEDVFDIQADQDFTVSQDLRQLTTSVI